MTNSTAAQVLAEATLAAESALNIDRDTAFNLAIANMIAEDAETMRTFLDAALTEFQKETT